MTTDWEVPVLPSDPPEFLKLRGGDIVIRGVEDCASDALEAAFSEDLDLRPLMSSDLRSRAVNHRDPCCGPSL